MAPSSTLQGGTFEPSGALYASATQNINVPTDFSATPANPPEVSLPAIAAFEVRGASSFMVLLGGRSSIPGQNDRGVSASAFEPDNSPCSE